MGNLKRIGPYVAFALVCLFLPVSGVAQGGVAAQTFTPWRTVGNALYTAPGAAVTVCSATASVTNGVCFPAENDGNCCFVDATLLVHIPTNPFLVGGDGNVSPFFAAPGTYQVSVAGSGLTAKTFPVTVAGTGAGTVVPSGTYSWTAPQSFINVDDILWVGAPAGYANIAAAVAAAGINNPTIIGIRSTYAGTECPAVQNNLVFLDFRAGGRTGSGTSSFICTQNTVQYNTKTPGFTDAMLRMELTRTAVDATGSILPLYPIGHLKNATVTGGVVEGVSPECDIDGTLSGTLDFCVGFEGAALYNVATGGTVTTMVGGMGYAQSTVGSTTNTVNAIGLWGRGAIAPFPTAPTNAYGVQCDAQSLGSARNYCFYAKGINLAGFSGGVGGWDFEDNANVTHRGLFVANDNSINLQAVNAIGVNISDSAGAPRLNLNASGLSINAGTRLTTSNQTGTGNLVLQASPSFLSGIGQGSGFKHQRFGGVLGGTCPTAAAAGAPCTSGNLNWTAPFADNSYTVVCTLNGSMTGQPHIVSTTYQAAGAGITITIAADTAVAANVAAAGFVDCTGTHD